MIGGGPSVCRSLKHNPTKRADYIYIFKPCITTTPLSAALTPPSTPSHLLPKPNPHTQHSPPFKHDAVLDVRLAAVSVVVALWRSPAPESSLVNPPLGHFAVSAWVYVCAHQHQCLHVVDGAAESDLVVAQS